MTQAPRSQGRKRTLSQVTVVAKKRKTGKRRAVVRRITQPGLILPDKLITTLTYSSVVSYAPGVAAEDRQFNLNSLFDPDRTGTGHQPMGFDQLKTFYNRYRVLSCKWEVNHIPTGCVGPILLVVVPSNDTTGLASDSQTAIETMYAKYKWSSHQHTAAGYDGRGPLKMTGSMNMGKLYGVTDAVLKADDRYAAEQGANPAEAGILHVVSFNQTFGVIVYDLSVKLVYTVEVYDRQPIAGS